MKLALAFFGVVVVAVTAAFVVACSSNRDTTPDTLSGCIQDLGLGRLISPTALGPAVPDVEAGRLPAAQRMPLRGGSFATVLRPADRAYTLIVVTRRRESVPAVLKLVSTVPDEQVYVVLSESASLTRALGVCLDAVKA